MKPLVRRDKATSKRGAIRTPASPSLKSSSKAKPRSSGKAPPSPLPANSAVEAGKTRNLAIEESIFQAVEEIVDPIIPAELFDEAGYLRLNPDVQKAVELGALKSGYLHYVTHGHTEGRALPDFPQESRNEMLLSFESRQTEEPPPQIRCAVDALIISPSHGIMIVGWIDDSKNPINCIRLIGSGWRLVIDAPRLIRLRRMDVEAALESRAQHAFGFFGFLHFDRGGHSSGPVRVEFWQSGGYSAALDCSAATVEESELRNVSLAYLAEASFFGNSTVEAIRSLARGTGNELVQFNRAITRQIVAKPYVQRFGRQRASPRGTIVVCLYGKPEFYFLQNCLFGGLPGIEDYEFIYISNSPEMAESLLNEAQSASRTYGLTNAIVILPGNAGFGGANNVASQFARSDRLLFVNPDVFPKDRDWAHKHTMVLDDAPTVQTRLFGVPLYYDDGSLMHGGMFFETDVALSYSGGASVPHRLCRVEHYGKGAPSESRQFTRPRPVPAVTGAFISIDRPWFERLGGFTEDFIYGHYEDADLCLKSLTRGVAPWLHDIRMWHLEGKGSTRQLPHQGGSLVNRWLFTETWLNTIDNGLNGPEPSHPLLELNPELPFPAKQTAPVKGRTGRGNRVVT